ncbi:9672_t:CDS:10 [Funneliformis caledonium]|uniref:9672_t:CDS:1 n=1 Tax=Funneliformis caledonium TaxID=1117310 RepID=A0A9N8WH01_9GLOM|nr:9672_t:CDS:10 [Funneliformis caledonium]
MGHEIFILEQEIDVIDKPHNGSPITMMEISPNAKYIITYSEKDKTIVGWNVDDEEGQLRPDCTIKSDKIFRFNKTEEIDEEDEKKIFHMCVSDEKKLVLSYVEYGSHIEGIGSKDIHEYLKIIDMKNQNQEMELYFKFIIDRFYCNFNSKGEFILYNIIEKSLSIPMFGNDKKKSYNRTSIIWIYSTQTKKWKCQEIYEVPQGVELINISQHDKIRLSLNNNIYERSISDDTTMSKLSKNLCEIKSKDIKMSSNEGFIYLKINDEITVYSTEPETPIASFDLKVENHDGYVWKINFDELEFDELELVSKEFEANDVTESWNAYFGKENDNNEYEDPFIPCENINRSKLFRKATVKYESKDIKLEIYTNIRMTGFIGLRVFENDNVIERIKKTKCKKTIDIYKVKIFNSKEIIILTSIGIFIFHLNQDDLILNHFLNICLSDVELKFLVDETFWVSHEETDRYNFLKYSVELITAIRERDIESVDGIYKKCLDYFKRDLVNNKAFLSIITNSISLLNRYYPEYIIKYSSDTNMIIDSLDYNIERLNISHLYPFEGIKLVNLTPSLAWTKYNYLLKRIVDKSNGILHGIMLFILSCQYVLCAYSSPISFLTFNILDRFHIVNNIVKYDMSAYFYYSLSYTSSKPTITFMIPYIKFVSYPEDYDWIEELFHPQPSPFIETISSEIYKTWGGEALINFKWNSFGKYYFAIIWMEFAILLGCFTTAATLSEDYLTEDIKKNLFIASIILASINLTFIYRRQLCSPDESICNVFYLFDLAAYILSIASSFYYENTWLLSLTPKLNYSLDNYTNNKDQNNPWNLASSYNQLLEDGSISSNPFIIQKPNENTNMFANFETALLAMYLSLTGDLNSFANWTYKENPFFVLLMISFFSVVVVYLLNLLIGLLNNAIDEDNNRVSYLVHKAEILKEIELFYLLPFQRRWKSWFPDVMYYYADVDETRRKVNDLIKKGEWNPNKLEFSEMKRNLLKKLNIKYDPDDYTHRVKSQAYRCLCSSPNITTKTTNALSIFRHHDPAPATEAVIREFKLWVQYANAAYYDVKGWECDVCKGDTDGTRLIEIFPFSSQRNNGYVAINDEKKAIIVAYSGTTDDPSLLLDYKIVQVPYSPSVPNAMVHSGFMIFYHATKEGITSLTKNLVKEYPSYKVITTGHSLGGVLATFQTLDLIGTPGLNPSNLFTYTYGEPRSGNKEFAQFIMNSGYKFFRLVDKGDIIPHLPPNYTHYGPEFWINPKNEIVVCQKADDKRCSNSILIKNLEDHDIDTYVKDLSAM